MLLMLMKFTMALPPIAQHEFPIIDAHSDAIRD